MRSSRALLSVALLASACGPGVDDLSLSAAPIAYVRGHVDLAAVEQVAGGKPLRAALVWGAVPNYVAACLKYLGNAELQAACPDPFGFVPGQVEGDVEVALDGDGSFSIPVRRLPDASLSVGNDTARIAWGSVIVAADSNGNGAFDLLSRSVDRSQPPKLADVAVAASFFSLLTPQQRLGFREGGYDEASLFYPAPGCVAPPAGFSVLNAPGVVVGSDMKLYAAQGECVSSALEATVEATPLSAAQSRGLACRSLNNASVRRPGSEPPGQDDHQGYDEDGKQLCLDKDTLAIVSGGDCPTVTVMPLAGCRNNLICDPPDWDLTSQRPGWWPCEQ